MQRFISIHLIGVLLAGLLPRVDAWAATVHSSRVAGVCQLDALSATPLWMKAVRSESHAPMTEQRHAANLRRHILGYTYQTFWTAQIEKRRRFYANALPVVLDHLVEKSNEPVTGVVIDSSLRAYTVTLPFEQSSVTALVILNFEAFSDKVQIYLESPQFPNTGALFNFRHVNNRWEIGGQDIHSRHLWESWMHYGVIHLSSLLVEKVFKRAEGIYPSVHTTSLGVRKHAMFFIHQGQQNKASEVLAEGVRQFPQDVKLKALWLNHQVRQRQYERVIHELDQNRELVMQDNALRLVEVRLYRTMAQFATPAQREWMSQRGTPYRETAAVWHDLGNRPTSGALANAFQSYPAGESRDFVLSTLLDWYLSLHHYDYALRVISRFPTDGPLVRAIVAQLYADRSYEHRHRNELTLSHQDMWEAVQWDPRPEWFLSVVSNLVRAHELEKGRTLWKKLHNDTPDDPAVSDMNVNLLIREKNLRTALVMAIRNVIHFPDDLGAHLRLADILRIQHQFPQALSVLEPLMLKSPHDQMVQHHYQRVISDVRRFNANVSTPRSGAGSAMTLEHTLRRFPGLPSYVVSVFVAPFAEVWPWILHPIRYVRIHDNTTDDGRYAPWKFHLRMAQLVIKHLSFFAVPVVGVTFIPSVWVNVLPDYYQALLLVMLFPLGFFGSHMLMNAVTFWIGAAMTLPGLPGLPKYWDEIESLRYHRHTYEAALVKIREELKSHPGHVELRAIGIELVARLGSAGAVLQKAERLAREHPHNFSVLYALKRVYRGLNRTKDMHDITAYLMSTHPEYRQTKEMRERLKENSDFDALEREWLQAVRTKNTRSIRFLGMFIANKGYVLHAVKWVNAWALQFPSSFASILLADVIAVRAHQLFDAKYHLPAIALMKKALDVWDVMEHRRVLEIWERKSAAATEKLIRQMA